MIFQVFVCETEDSIQSRVIPYMDIKVTCYKVHIVI